MPLPLLILAIPVLIKLVSKLLPVTWRDVFSYSIVSFLLGIVTVTQIRILWNAVENHERLSYPGIGPLAIYVIVFFELCATLAALVWFLKTTTIQQKMLALILSFVNGSLTVLLIYFLTAVGPIRS